VFGVFSSGRYSLIQASSDASVTERTARPGVFWSSSSLSESESRNSCTDEHPARSTSTSP
jgi:hypothetical protein